ncbi:putative SOS response-associated peptidase YedK [Anaerotignum neopropionicum]|uniref:Abasic site processing protein n=1 Tax=Anaerotignum neopropionicum TaxID=36847 RepID=A0A136WHQ1_9FIRM|nr:SOS response-associated peptidase family protein [Anaerotignum neopropionicum]KXL54007.1 putative SOS response-associated peptidase YedK [Anaerotignum neopropionicum]
MCRQFLWRQEENSKAVQKIMAEIRRKSPNAALPQIARPANSIPYLLVSPEGTTTASVGRWGFQVQGKGLVYNARQETALTKGLFRGCFQNGRCIVPAHSFFEWDKERHCFAFSQKEKELLYFAALYRTHQNGAEIVILTTHSSKTVDEVHHRMPLILGEKELRPWLYDTSASQFLLSQGIGALKKEIVEY